VELMYRRIEDGPVRRRAAGHAPTCPCHLRHFEQWQYSPPSSVTSVCP
jgi:hypothetical protein